MAIATLIASRPDLPPATPSAGHPATDIPVVCRPQLWSAPDIAAAERRVAEATSRSASQPPTIDRELNALGRFGRNSFGNVLNGVEPPLAVGGVDHATILRGGGRRRATSDAALARYDATVGRLPPAR